MPDVVSHGRRPTVWACGYCHLPDGAGRPENAALAGLPVKYIAQQMATFRSGTRASPWHMPNKPADVMRTIADSTAPSEVAAAARYFSRLPPRRRAQVVETDRIPRVRPAVGLYFLAPEGGEEPLPPATHRGRIGMPSATSSTTRGAEYVAYVPPGSIARGKVLATRGIPGLIQSCASCHGPRLREISPVPPIAGRSPSYMLRQLLGFAAGARSSAEASQCARSRRRSNWMT